MSNVVENDKILNQQEKQIKNGLENFIRSLVNVTDYDTYLENSFELFIKAFDRNKIFILLYQQLSEYINTDANNLFGYLAYNKNFDAEDLDLNDIIYKRAVESINKLKSKYGILIRNLISQSKQPFLINACEINIENMSSMHNIRIHRADGESLSGLFKTDTLMAIVLNLIEAMRGSMQSGTYTLDSSLVRLYLEKSDEFRNFMFSELDKHGLLKK